MNTCPHCGLALPRAKTPLTRKQRDVFDFLGEFYAVHRRSATFQEVATHFGYRSLATVHEYVARLREKGWLADFEPNTSYTLVPR